jgi:hypothetical protein
MMTFDDLPKTTRALLLATLDLEIASAGCANVVDLAQKRKQSVSDVWRDICRKAGQARCLMPPQLLKSEYAAFSPAACSVAAEAAASPRSFQPHSHTTTTPVSRGSRSESESIRTAATVAPVRSASRAPTARAPNRLVVLAVGLCLLVAMGIGLYIVASPSETTTTATVRPAETVNVRHATSHERDLSESKQAPGPASVPVSPGTIRRIDAISKSFSKK